MYNVIRKYMSVEQIEYPDRRNYLEHLLRTKKELENIQDLEFDEEEAKLKTEYLATHLLSGRKYSFEVLFI